jgi:pterin-4a-carbinolamine dehydratase
MVVQLLFGRKFENTELTPWQVWQRKINKNSTWPKLPTSGYSITRASTLAECLYHHPLILSLPSVCLITLDQLSNTGLLLTM